MNKIRDKYLPVLNGYITCFFFLKKDVRLTFEPLLLKEQQTRNETDTVYFM